MSLIPETERSELSETLHSIREAVRERLPASVDVAEQTTWDSRRPADGR